MNINDLLQYIDSQKRQAGGLLKDIAQNPRQGLTSIKDRLNQNVREWDREMMGLLGDTTSVVPEVRERGMESLLERMPMPAVGMTRQQGKMADTFRKTQESLHTTPVGPVSPVLFDKAPVPAVHGQRAFPGIYDDPRKILEDAVVAPEHPLLGKVFNTSRHDLDEAALRMQDPAVANPLVYIPTKAPEHVERVMNKKNTQRVRSLIELGADSEKMAGMPGWYVTQPMKQRAEELLGPDLAEKFFRQHHAFASPMSAMGAVDSEIAKGTLAHLLFGQGRAGEFFDRSKMPKWLQTTAYPTGYSSAMRNLIESGGERFWKAGGELAADAPSPKTPNYFFSKTGENWYWPTADAHFVRGVGLPDVRPIKTYKTGPAQNVDSIGTTEMAPIGEWFANDVLRGTGLSGNVGQPVLWGMLASKTGVKTPIGAPYLEILASNIGKTGQRRNKTAQQAWDDYILGSMGMKEVDPLQDYLGGFATGSGAR